MREIDESIIRRIKACLNLADGRNATEAEAALALERAHDLLAKHNLTMSDVRESGKERLGVVQPIESGDDNMWRIAIGGAISMLYFSGYFVRHMDTGTRHYFVGTQANALTTRMLFQYLTNTIERSAQEGADKIPPDERTAYVETFCSTAAFRLVKRIRARMEESRTKGLVGTANALVVASMYDQAKAEIDAFMEENIGAKSLIPYRPELSHLQGYADGAHLGEAIGFDQQVAGGDAKKLTAS